MCSDKTDKVLILVTDQHRWDCLGFMREQIETPHIDRLRSMATHFENGFCPFPMCTPSRYSMLSGLYVHQHGGDTNSCTLAPGHATFPKELRQAGFRTKAVGKMHFRPTYLDVGFAEMRLAEQCGPGRLEDDYHRGLQAAGLVDTEDWIDQVKEFRDLAPTLYWERLGAVESSLPEKWHSTTWIGDQAVSSLGEWGSEPELLMVSFIKPHHPFDPPKRWLDFYRERRIDLLPGWMEQIPGVDHPTTGFFPAGSLTRERMEEVTRHYFATISHIDEQVGRIMEQLEKNGHLDETAIVFTSDHGEYLGFHHRILKDRHLYDPLLRVPLLIKEKGQRAGSTDNRMVSLVDLAPTILDYAGREIPAGMGGLRLGRDESRETVFAQGWGASSYMVRTSRHKLVYARKEEESQLFDLQADPLETCNLYGNEALSGVEASLKQQLFHWILFDQSGPTYIDDTSAGVPLGPGQETGPTARARSLEFFRRTLAPVLKDPSLESSS